MMPVQPTVHVLPCPIESAGQPSLRPLPSPKREAPRSTVPTRKRHDPVFRVLDQQIHSYFDEWQRETARDGAAWKRWNDESRALCLLRLLEDEDLSEVDQLKVHLWKHLGGIVVDVAMVCDVVTEGEPAVCAALPALPSEAA